MNPFSYEVGADDPLHPDQTINAQMTEFDWPKILVSDSQN